MAPPDIHAELLLAEKLSEMSSCDPVAKMAPPDDEVEWNDSEMFRSAREELTTTKADAEQLEMCKLAMKTSEAELPFIHGVRGTVQIDNGAVPSAFKSPIIRVPLRGTMREPLSTAPAEPLITTW
jgi:hypothetical protein